MVKLGAEQEIAINLIKEFISKSKEIAFSLMGSAGTGKTTIMKHLIDYLENEGIEYVLVAPTHQAKSILKHSTERDATTLHSLLKLFPNIEIMNLDLRDLKFNNNALSSESIPFKGLVICDESSMINDVLFNLLIDKCDKSLSKILFVGDPAQLKPVNSINKSLVFNTKDFYELKTIYRQSNDSALFEVLPILRENIINRFKTIEKPEGSIICLNTAKELFSKAIPYFRNSIEQGDIFNAKMYAYTNTRTKALNNKIREILFPGNDQYYVNEILTCYENFSYNYSNYWNSMNYIVKKVEFTDYMIPHIGKMPGFYLHLYDTSENSTDKIFILDKNINNDILYSIAAIIEETRLRAVELKKSRNSAAKFVWKKYFEIINNFSTPVDLVYDDRVVKKKTFDYGYASTVHKSQGSSINNVFIDMKDILSCRDLLEIRQLQYVSISRSRNNVFILQ